jgi:hypothetical protein
MAKNSSSRPLPPPEVVVDGRGLVWREAEVVDVDSDDDIWEDKLLLVLLGAVITKDVFFFCRTLAMVFASGGVCDE